MRTLDFKEFAKEIHQNACDKGFWEDEREDGTIIALIHSEISEAHMAVLDDTRSEKIPGFMGIEEELADIIIRVLDFTAHEGLEYPDTMVRIINPTHYNCFGEYHILVSKALESFRADERTNAFKYLFGLVAALEMGAKRNEYRLEEAILAKHEYNKKRPYKHGKKF